MRVGYQAFLQATPEGKLHIRTDYNIRTPLCKLQRTSGEPWIEREFTATEFIEVSRRYGLCVSCDTARPAYKLTYEKTIWVWALGDESQ
jgi:hypothetical protein